MDARGLTEAARWDLLGATLEVELADAIEILQDMLDEVKDRSHSAELSPKQWQDQCSALEHFVTKDHHFERSPASRVCGVFKTLRALILAGDYLVAGKG
jgi:hypothetical protein